MLWWRVSYVPLNGLGAYAAPCLRLPICVIVCAELWGLGRGVLLACLTLAAGCCWWGPGEAR